MTDYVDYQGNLVQQVYQGEFDSDSDSDSQMVPVVEWMLDVNPDNSTSIYNDLTLLQRENELDYVYVGIQCYIPDDVSLGLPGTDVNVGQSYSFGCRLLTPEFDPESPHNVVSLEYMKTTSQWRIRPWHNYQDPQGTWIQCRQENSLGERFVTMVAKHCPDVDPNYYRILLDHIPGPEEALLGHDGMGNVTFGPPPEESLASNSEAETASESSAGETASTDEDYGLNLSRAELYMPSDLESEASDDTARG